MSQMPIVDYDFIRQLHRKLMEKFKYITDKQQHGLVEYWEGDVELNTMLRGMSFHGDCEEFARAAMLETRKRPSLRARLIACIVETGEGHCVCEISNLEGSDSFILDNRQHQLMQYNGLPKYTFVCASPWNPQPGDDRPWLLLNGA